MYSWSMSITANYTGSTSTTTFTGTQAVVNRTSSEFGNGWGLAGFDQLVVDGKGGLLVRGKGDTLWCADNGSGYDPAPGDLDFSTLTQLSGGGYRITTKHGESENFYSDGKL